VYFAWHQQKDRVVFAAFDLRGDVVMEPAIVGKGRWPRLTVDGQRVALAWAGAKNFVVRVHDGKEWGDEFALTGKEAAIAFSPGGALQRSHLDRLWKLAGAKFERTKEAAYAQPALALDAKGEPQVAWRRDGRVVVNGQDVAEGKPHAGHRERRRDASAYLTKSRLGSPRAQGEDWGNAETHSASQPSWPALAPLRRRRAAHYLGAAEHGRTRFGFCRAPRRNPS